MGWKLTFRAHLNLKKSKQINNYNHSKRNTEIYIFMGINSRNQLAHCAAMRIYLLLPPLGLYSQVFYQDQIKLPWWRWSVNLLASFIAAYGLFFYIWEVTYSNFKKEIIIELSLFKSLFFNYNNCRSINFT